MARCYPLIILLTCLISCTAIHAAGNSGTQPQIELEEIAHDETVVELLPEEDTSHHDDINNKTTTSKITIDAEEYQHLKNTNILWSLSKKAFAVGCTALLLSNISTSGTTYYGLEKINSLVSPITAYPYLHENGAYVAPELEYNPECSYYDINLNNTGYKPDYAKGSCLFVQNKGRGGKYYCTIEDCDQQDKYKKALKIARSGFMWTNGLITLPACLVTAAYALHGVMSMITKCSLKLLMHKNNILYT